MEDHYQATIEALRAEVSTLEERATRTKQLVNLLCEKAAIPAAYPDANSPRDSGGAVMRGDEFFNRPLNTSVKSLLARRKSAGLGPATAEDIHAGLIKGGCDKFPPDKEDALTGLRISLGKSSHTFVRLPNGTYGLCEWYDIKKRATTANNKAGHTKNDNSTVAEELDATASDFAEANTSGAEDNGGGPEE